MYPFGSHRPSEQTGSKLGGLGRQQGGVDNAGIDFEPVFS
jgi:hypothetical protein